MSRKRLGRRPSEVIQVRVPGELAEQIDFELMMAGEDRSERGRKLFEAWVRRRRAIKRLKAKGGPP